MEFILCKKEDVGMYTDRATHVLTLLDTQMDFAYPSIVSHLDRLKIGMEDTMDYSDPEAPTKDQVRMILSWANCLPSDAIVIVHCQMAISRSPAALYAILTQKYGDYERALDEVVRQRPICSPNPIMTKYADELLGYNGKMHAHAEKMISPLMIMAAKDV